MKMNPDAPGYRLMRKYLAIQVRYHRLACERLSIWTLPPDQRPAVDYDAARQAVGHELTRAFVGHTYAEFMEARNAACPEPVDKFRRALLNFVGLFMDGPKLRDRLDALGHAHPDLLAAAAGCKGELIEASMVLDDWARAQSLLTAWEMDADTLADVLRTGLESTAGKGL